MAYVVVATVLALIALVCVLIAAKQRDILAKTLDELDRLREERQVIIDFLHRSADDIGSGANREKIYKRTVRATALSCGHRPHRYRYSGVLRIPRGVGLHDLRPLPHDSLAVPAVSLLLGADCRRRDRLFCLCLPPVRPALAAARRPGAPVRGGEGYGHQSHHFCRAKRTDRPPTRQHAHRPGLHEPHRVRAVPGRTGTAQSQGNAAFITRQTPERAGRQQRPGALFFSI